MTKNKHYEYIKKWKNSNPIKVKAHRMVFVAIRNKTIKKQNCFCGNEKSEAHHEDYFNPLDIIWLCKKHHREADAKRRHNPKLLSQKYIIDDEKYNDSELPPGLSVEENWDILLKVMKDIKISI